jgi:hypothetical protein
VLPPDADQKQRALPASAGAAQMARAWAMFSGEFFQGPDARLLDPGGPRFIVERIIGGQRVRCEVERSTLTPRLYTMADRAGAGRFTLAQDRYALFSGIAWPTRLRATSETGALELELHDVELNGELPPNAFVAPRRAEKLP